MTSVSPLFGDFYAGKGVLITGHTGFKGGWLSLWLHRLGAFVHGYALDPPTSPSFFAEANVAKALTSDTRADLLDLASLTAAFKRSRPEIVFHLAAQSLVRASYRDPLGTFASNVTGTAHLLDAARASDSTQVIVVVTTDKVYEANHDLKSPYRETDRLGGRDPYSASKAAAEIVAASYRASFFCRDAGKHARVATARAGNVIGGGDWSAERLLPDCLKAFAGNETVLLRFPHAVRPWQHVLEPLSGYMRLAEKLFPEGDTEFAGAWNFGPNAASNATVAQVATMTAEAWGSEARVGHSPSEENPHEEGLLLLDSTLARTALGWNPRWSLEQSVAETVAWHRAWRSGTDMAAYSHDQIRRYEEALP